MQHMYSAAQPAAAEARLQPPLPPPPSVSPRLALGHNGTVVACRTKSATGRLVAGREEHSDDFGSVDILPVLHLGVLLLHKQTHAHDRRNIRIQTIHTYTCTTPDRLVVVVKLDPLAVPLARADEPAHTPISARLALPLPLGHARERFEFGRDAEALLAADNKGGWCKLGHLGV